MVIKRRHSKRRTVVWIPLDRPCEQVECQSDPVLLE